MIANVFEVLAKQLNAYFKTAPSRTFHTANSNLTDAPPIFGGDNDPVVEIVNFLQDQDQQEFIKFALNKVTPVLVNIEEEGILRPADRFSRVSDNGNREMAFPDVRLNLYILWVSNFFDYTDSLYYLGLIIRYFQTHPVLDQQNTPDLLPETGKLVIEHVSLPFAEQNEVWNSLRSAYHPSLLYKVKMLVFQDQPDPMGAGEIKQVNINVDGQGAD